MPELIDEGHKVRDTGFQHTWSTHWLSWCSEELHLLERGGDSCRFLLVLVLDSERAMTTPLKHPAPLSWPVCTLTVKAEVVGRREG